MRRFFAILLKILLGLGLLVVLAVVGALIALRVPSVQTRIGHEVADVLTQKLGQQVTIGGVDIRPFSRVLLDSVSVKDRRGGELFSIGRADANISLFSVFDPRHLHISTLTLNEPRFELKNLPGQPDSTTLDQFISSVKRLIGPSKDTAASQPFDFKVGSIALRNGHFAIEKGDVPRAKTYGRSIDYDHLLVDSIYADLSNIRLGDTLRVRISQLHAVETPSQSQLREITADMTYGPHFWEFKNLNLRVGRSQIKDYVRFEFRVFTNFTDYNDSMKTIARLRNSKVYSEDIAKFAPQLSELHESVALSGDAEGYVRDFKVNNLDLRYGSGTHIVARRAHADGLPNYKESFVDLRLLPSVVKTSDLKHWLPDAANKFVQKLGTVKLQGQVLGFYDDFVANASFDTALGFVATDVNLKTKTDLTHAAYSGTVRSNAFQLGKFLGDESVIRDVTLNGRVDGVGFLPESARGRAKLTVPAIWLSGHRYQNVAFDGDFRPQHFNGHVSVNDPAVRLVADGLIDLERKHENVAVKTKIERADLRALGLLSQPLIVSTTADVKFKGVQLDSLIGYAYLRNSLFTMGKRRLRLDTLDVVSTRNRLNQRRVTLRSEAVDASVAGTFNTSDVVRDVQTLLTEYRLNFESNATATADYYRRKRQRALPVYQIDLKANLKKPNPVLSLFVPELTVANGSRIDGSFRNGETSIFQLGGHLDSLRYGPVMTINNDFDFLTSKLPYKPDILAQASVTSDRQVLPGLGKTEKFIVEGVWDQQRINFSTSLAQTGATNKATINGSMGFLPRAVEVVFRQSGVHLLDKDWTIAADNSVRISDYGREFDIKNLTFSNGEQFVGAQGFISPDASKPPLQLQVKDFQLATLNTLTGQRLGGRVNAQGTMSGVYGPLTINSTLGVDSLTYDGTLIGQVAGRGDWDNTASKLRVNLDVARAGQSVLTVLGDIAPRDNTNQFNLTGTLNDAPIVLAQPFLGSIMKNLSGTGRGELRLTGLFGSPNLLGAVDVSNGRFTFGYLGTTYTFADRISFTNTSIAFRNVKVRDALGNTGTVDGVVSHHGFQDMSLDIAASFRKLQVLNTTRKDNDLYFGTAYATGTARVTGPTDDLTVTVRATSEAGTRLSLPFDNAASAQKAGYIKFVNNNPLGDTVMIRKAKLVAATQQKIDLSGITLNMNLTVTPDAYLEILLDESTGDVIRGSAAGQLRLAIDTRGEFNMYGQVEIVRGAYNFTLQGLVNKEFVVRPGGVVSWNGDPLAGEMNITATYTQRTSLAPVLESGSVGSVAVVPVTAVMNLTGPLLLPAIRLNLEFNDAPSTLQGELAAFTASLRNDEQELNRQVFSLLVFKQLSPRGSSLGSSISIKGQDNTVQNSLGQILSTQLGLLTNQIDQNLEIDFNINGLTAEQLQALQVRLSYSFLNGRLRVTREGGFTNNSNLVNSTPGTPSPIGGNTAGQASLLGDLSLEYYLRPDGKFRTKLRYETTPRDLETINQPRAGLSLLHTEQFNTFGELFSRKNPKKNERRTQRAREGKEVLNVDEDPRTNL
ncbi:translocation/assembly module TamB domain-containing protein [Hymenobacter properus]|uniref:Translocation/assembly module TamB domain-containing protein n=1 Tax=Hymenobacter properus TaxID=2791026 RepID=A0A931BEB0_9BACT|nr:translocation/assembly module TamB domain-containing protein [Hymenobacter properus]MBF9142224.1 translocation/assembly module TamB domain-containing protein [Hymenobacter properus]MBR7721031.1 translocation/assembly module TamB domain-containing protein [Microvirga sp. SRT04]